MPIQPQGELIHRVAHKGQPPGALDDTVEQVTVRDPKLAAIRRLMNPILDHLDAAEVVNHVAARKFVVGAWHESHTRALAGLAQHLLKDIVVGLWPVPLASQLPAIDDVADKKQRVALGALQEVQRCPGLAAGRAKVQVGNPERSKSQAALRAVIVVLARGRLERAPRRRR